jgi:hypothetical protein
MNLPLRFNVLALIACCGLAPVARAGASTGIFQIIGYVRDNSSNAVVGVDIAVDDYVGDYYFGTTDADGFYVVNVDADSNYRATANCSQLNAKGYECPPPIAMTINDGGLEVDFVIQSLESTPLQITNVSLPNANAGLAYQAQLGATGGKIPYDWRLAADSAALPEGLALNASGLISGTTPTNGAAIIKVQVRDANGAVTNKVFSLGINPRPILNALAWMTNRFSMLLVGASNQNYTIQSSATLGSNWTSILITNSPTASTFIVTDAGATNSQKMYRALIGP